MPPSEASGKASTDALTAQQTVLSAVEGQRRSPPTWNFLARLPPFKSQADLSEGRDRHRRDMDSGVWRRTNGEVSDCVESLHLWQLYVRTLVWRGGFMTEDWATYSAVAWRQWDRVGRDLGVASGEPCTNAQSLEWRCESCIGERR